MPIHVQQKILSCRTLLTRLLPIPRTQNEQMEAASVLSPPDYREPLSRKPSKQEPWGQAALPHLNGQREAMVGQEKAVPGKAAQMVNNCTRPQTEMQQLCEEMEDQWETLNLPVFPVAHPAAPLSFATVQWDMPDPSVDLPSPMNDNSSTDELDSSGGASLDWTISPLSNPVCRERDTELPVQEDIEQCAELEERPLKDNDPDQGVDVSQPCDAPGAGIEEQKFQEGEEDPTLGLIGDNDAETEMDPLLHQGTTAASEPSLSPPVRAELPSEHEVDSQSGTSELEQETTGVLLTGETDSDQEYSAATGGGETEEEDDREGEQEVAERQWIVTNYPDLKCKVAQPDDCRSSGEIEPCEEPPQTNHRATLTVNVEQLDFSEQRLKEKTPENKTDTEETSTPPAAFEEVQPFGHAPRQTHQFVHVGASEESDTAQSQHTKEGEREEPVTRNEEPACVASKQGEQRDQTEGSQQLEPVNEAQQLKEQDHSRIGKEVGLSESTEPCQTQQSEEKGCFEHSEQSEQSEPPQHSNEMLVLPEEIELTVHPETSIESHHTLQLQQVQSKKSDLLEEIEQAGQPKQLMDTQQPEQIELTEASKQPNQSENTEERDSSEQFNQSENTEQRDASEQPNQSEITEHSDASEQPNQSENIEQSDASEQPNQSENTEQGDDSEQPNQSENTEQSTASKQPNQSGNTEQRDASEQPNQSENTEQRDASEQPNQSENTEQSTASKQPNQSENTEQSTASKQPDQSENKEQRDVSEQPCQSEQMEQLPPHGQNLGQNILTLSQQEGIPSKQVCEQQQHQQLIEELENIEQKRPKTEETELEKEEKQTENFTNSQNCQLSEQSRQNVGCTGTGDSGMQIVEEKGEPIDNPSEPAQEPEPGAGQDPPPAPAQASTPVAAEQRMNRGGVDRQKARELAERLYRLDGFQRTDVVKHLDKDNDFSRAVGEEYLKFFDFTDQSLDQALRSFLKVVVLIGETQERERVLQHFSCCYQQCNPHSFSSTGTVLTLTCAVMLLNSDLHGENVGKAMSSSDFVSNLDGMNEGENFSKDLLKSLFNSIKNDPLEWAVDEMELKSSMLLVEDAKEDAPARCKSNPFQDVPHDKKAKVFKQGFLQRKAHADIDGKRTPWGKRSWKTFYGVLKGMVLYLQKDEYRKEEYQSTEEVVSVHHALAERAADYNKRPHVFRLQTADWRVFLFQATSRAEMSSWISRINLVSALHSSPPFPAAVGSQRRFHRPILPASQSAHTLDRQLQCHRGMLESFQEDLAYLQQSLPEGRKAKARELEEHRQREEYLLHETCRYEVYIQMLEAWDGLNESAVTGTAEFARFDRMVCQNPVEDLGEDELEGGLKKSYSSPSLEVELAPPPLVKVRRNISERRTYRKIVIPRRNKDL